MRACMQMASPVKNCQNYTSPLEFTLEEEAASARVVMKLARDMIYLIEVLNCVICPQWQIYRCSRHKGVPKSHFLHVCKYKVIKEMSHSMLNLKLFSKHMYLFGPGKNIWTWEEYLNICLFASLVRDHLAW